jgi:serine/threonine protein kinase
LDATWAHRGTTRLGSYEILRKLTRGGMAEIFLARTSGPSGFEKLVVLKKILGRYADRPRYVQLFLDEARLAASLDHPNIVQVYDIGMVDGSYFFTMEYLHGQDVRSILHRAWRIGERLPVEHAVQIARHVASALHFAHDKRRGDGTLLGLVHRDVSPSNIIVTYDGATKLLDFGVAKTAASTVKTRTGALKGKIAYMSPEQARGAPVDRRSDIFSLGIVLWEMVTTQRLYRADNDLATLQLIVHRPPRRPSEICPDCPPELERIVLRALARDPAQRYQTAEQLVTELDELAREHKLKQSPNALAAGLAELFGSEIQAWRAAQAAGVALAEHLHQIGDTTAPISESDFVDVPDPPDGEEADEVDDGEQLELEDADRDRGRAEAPEDGDDEDSDDDDLTEHAAPIDVLSPLAAESLGEPKTVPDAQAEELPTPPNRARTRPSAAPPVLDGALPVLHGPLSETSTTLTAPAGPPTVTGPTLTAPPVVSPRATPSAPFAPVASSPYAAPPWQSGQPLSPPPAERALRSWAIIDLPAFDPESFERQRRIVLRVAAGLIGLVILLAVITGHC